MDAWKVRPDPLLQERIDGMAQELMRQSADLAAAEYRWLVLLAEFDAVGGWAAGGARSCAEWLSWGCGVSLPAARERARVARALPDLPLVSAAFAAGRMSYSKVRAVTRVATPDNEALLVMFAESATAQQLEVVVRGYRKSQDAEEAKEAHRQFERRSVRWWVDDEGFIRIAARLPYDDGAFIVGEMERLAESGGEDEAAEPAPEAERVSAETARRLACDATTVTLVEDDAGRPLGVGRQSSKVPRWLRRALKRRDRDCCRFPSCEASRFVDAHHVVHWADGGPTELDNLILLCRFHHRLVHEVGYRVRRDNDGGFTLLRPDATVVPDTAPVVEGDAAAVETTNRQLGLDITWLTGLPRWDGHAPDYSSAIQALHDVSAETPEARDVG